MPRRVSALCVVHGNRGLASRFAESQEALCRASGIWAASRSGLWGDLQTTNGAH